MSQMRKKQSFSITTLNYTSPVALLIGLVLCIANAHAGMQETLDKKYTTNRHDTKVFMQSFSALNDTQQDTFMLGKSFFTVPWVEAPAATTARDGLGPLFSANTCISCHPKNGRGSLLNTNNSISRAYVTRLSIPSNGSLIHQEMLRYSGFVQEPNYGAQISINGIEAVAFEAKPRITYKNLRVTYPDKTTVMLKKPLSGAKDKLQDLQYGQLHKKVSITNRLAPALVGLGFLEQLSDAQILENQDINDTNNDNISGKANIVYSPSHKDFRIGRFTYKASAPSVLYQSAAAASNDMSLTNELFPNENCTQSQKECLEAQKGNSLAGGSVFDLPMKRLEVISFYLTHLKIPKSTITQKKGEELFASIGCVKCHIPSFTLKSGYTIKPFTDILLHDMGEGLSDGRSEYLALPSEWRTTALWGLGKYILASKQNPELLHDGRAKTIEEAILWHGGEAKEIKNNFMNLSAKNRKNLIDYIKEL